MADNNTVPLGQAGTGAAVILGENKAANVFLNDLDYLKRQKALQQEQAKKDAIAKAKALADSWKTSQLAARQGKLWDDQLAKIESEHINQGMNYVRSGQNPYDPLNPNSQQYAQDRRNILALREYRKDFEKNYNDVIQHSDKYDPEDLAKLNELVRTGDIRELYSNQVPFPMPSLKFDEAKAFSGRSAAMKNVKKLVGGKYIETTDIDRPATENGIISIYNESPEGQRALSRAIGGMSIADVKNLPDNINDIKKELESNYDGDPEFRKAAADNGIVKGTPAYDNWLNGQANQLYQNKQGYNDIISRGMARLGLGKTISNKETKYNDPFSLAWYRNWLGNQNGEDESTYRQQLIDGILSGDKAKIDKLNSYLPSESKVEYKTSKAVPGISKGGYNFVRINIPGYMDSNGKFHRGIKEDISLSRGPDAANRINAILNEVKTAGQVDMNKFNIEGGKPRGKEVNIKGEPKSYNKTTPSENSGMVRVMLENGQIGEIPSDKETINSFLRKYPNAKIQK